MDWSVSSQNLDVKASTPNVTVFGNGGFMEIGYMRP